MAIVNDHAPGTFCWWELGTTDQNAAKQFYGELFGWNSVDTPMGPDAVYTMLQRDGQNVGALYQLGAQQA
ncbi:MAG: VOC family protein, partial [Candidatus Kapaibacterium sp.]